MCLGEVMKRFKFCRDRCWPLRPLRSGLDPEAWLANGRNYPRIKIRAQNHEHRAVRSNRDLAADPDRVIGADAGLEFFFSPTFSFFLFFKWRIICLSLILLGVHCYVRNFSGCGKWGLRSRGGAQASRWGAFPCRRGQNAQAQLRHAGLVPAQHLEFSRTRDWTCVPCVGRWVLNHWATREILPYFFFKPGVNPLIRVISDMFLFSCGPKV